VPFGCRPRDLAHVAARVVDDGVASAAAVGAAHREGVWRYGDGVAGTLWPASVAEGAPCASLETVFDLASLTKPLTALAFARLERRGVIAREESLGAVLGQRLPSILVTASSDVPLDLLMAHRAGLVAHNPFYEGLLRGERPNLSEVLFAAANMRREGCEGSPPADGFGPIYSDLGYILIGAAMEARTGEPLDALMAREVVSALDLAPEDALGSARQLRAAGVAGDTFAPTEVVDWRGGLVRGVVHDENAWLVAGDGAAGHAGAFGTVGAVVALGRLVLDALAGRSAWLSPSELAPLIRPRPGGSLAAGFDRRSEEPGVTPASGAHFSSSTIGHLGFTGTSLWIDPVAEFAAVLLTNRVCPTREHIAIRRARPIAYDAMVHAMTMPVE